MLPTLRGGLSGDLTPLFRSQTSGAGGTAQTPQLLCRRKCDLIIVRRRTGGRHVLALFCEFC
jgi:hypothetical protein